MDPFYVQVFFFSVPINLNGLGEYCIVVFTVKLQKPFVDNNKQLTLFQTSIGMKVSRH